MRLSAWAIQAGQRSTKRARYDGGSSVPRPSTPRELNHGASAPVSLAEEGYHTGSVAPRMSAVVGYQRRAARAASPCSRYQAVSHRQNGGMTTATNRAPGLNMPPNRSPSQRRSATQFSTPKFAKAPSNV